MNRNRLDGEEPVMGIFSKHKDSDTGAGSGRGGTLGTPSHDAAEDVPSNDEDNMVVSDGDVADVSKDDAATGAGTRGLG